MFKYLKAVFSDSSIRNRIFFVIFILVLTRILSIIPIPTLSASDVASFVNNNQLLGLINIFAGGGLASLSIVMLGVQPYITASIIMQLVTALSPKLKALHQEEGELGRRKYNRYVRWLVPPLAVAQGYGLLTLFAKQNIIPAMSFSEMMFNVLIITAGSMLMMWLGEAINERGIGSGISLIIFAGIVATLPNTIISAISNITLDQIPVYIALVVTFILTLLGIVAVTEAERPIEVTHAKQSRGYASSGMSTTYLPIRLTMAGVIPVIFAISFLIFPQIMGTLFAKSEFLLLQNIANYLITALNNPWIYGAVYALLIIMFTFFYTMITFDPIKTSENLQKQGAFIPGHRPGEATTQYLGEVLTRITTIGAIFLASVALLPIILSGVTGISTLVVGGTSLLIAVSVVLDLMKKIDSQLTMREY